MVWLNVFLAIIGLGLLCGLAIMITLLVGVIMMFRRELRGDDEDMLYRLNEGCSRKWAALFGVDEKDVKKSHKYD